MTNELDEQLQAIIFEAQDYYNAYRTDDYIESYKRGIALLGDDLVKQDLGYTLVNELCEKTFEDKRMEVVSEWIEKYHECDLALRGFGNSEFLMAKIAHDNKDLDKARDCFKVADEKSGGRIWKGEKDPKYYMFYKKK